MLLRLAISQFRTRRVRAILTILAVALSVSLVVSVTTGYASLLAAAHKFLDVHLGSTDAQVTRQGDGRSGVGEDVVRLIRADPRVRRATGRLEIESRMLGKDGKPMGMRQITLNGIRLPDDDRVQPLRLVKGTWFDGGSGDSVVIDQGVANLLGVDVGDPVSFPGLNGTLTLKVVGIIHKPQIVVGYYLTGYAPIETLQEWIAPDVRPFVSTVLIDLKPGADADAFAAEWNERLATIDPTIRLKLSREVRKDLDRNLQQIQVLAMMGGAVSMVAATFIVFSSLSMGVAERQRTLAMMRAVGALKSQVGLLVVVEGLLLAGVGVAAGVPLGWTWVKLLTLKFPEPFSAGIVMSAGGVILGVGGSLAAALAASFLPAFSAMRVDPLEAMNPLSQPARAGVPVRAALLGLALAAIDPLILFIPVSRLFPDVGWPREVQFYGHFIVGIPALLLGFFLLGPVFVVAVERVLGPVVAALFGLRFSLLRQQLSGGIWRSAGTAAAMMVGLAILVVMQVQGRSALAAWRLPNRFPDVFIYTPATQMRLEDMKLIEGARGILPGQVAPITLASPEFGTNIFAIGVGMKFVPDATMFFGVDPDRTLGMMDLEFKAGDVDSAREALKNGRHVIVTEEFRKLKGLTVGDKLPLKTVNHGVVDYTICGVVWSPGIDVMVGIFDLGRQFEQRTVASVFGSIDDSVKDFGVDGVYLFAANLEPGVDKEVVLKQVRKQLNMLGLGVADVRQIKAGITKAFGYLLTIVSSVAFAAMGISALGVANTIMASVRSRRWQFGILRSIGLTRSQVLRLVVAEAVLLGLVGCALGLAAGGLLSVDAKQFALIAVGLAVPTVIPWQMIAIGGGAVMVVALLAGAGPALRVASREPLDLLQAGRAAG